MSLKVPRGFVTHSEDSIAATYTKLRVQSRSQDYIARRDREAAEARVKFARVAGLAVAAVALLAVAKPAYQFVSLFV